MDIETILKTKFGQEIANIIAKIAGSNDKNKISELSKFLLVRSDDTFDKHMIPRIACRAFLSLGIDGLKEMKNILPKTPGTIYPQSIIEAIWYTSKGIQPPNILLGNVTLPNNLNNDPSTELITESKILLRDIIVNSITNQDLFFHISEFITLQSMTNATFHEDFFKILTDCTIKINKDLIEEFERLIKDDHNEEKYQKFLKINPYFLDPLACIVISKKKLGCEYATDFVIQRLDNEYILVEIEKPSDKIFTLKDDFTSHFIHGYGQVIDFLEWIDSNGAYAQKSMPNISSPKGLLVIGRKDKLSVKQLNKLKRLNCTNNSIDIMTYDDLLLKANNLYKNLTNLEI